VRLDFVEKKKVDLSEIRLRDLSDPKGNVATKYQLNWFG